MRLREYVKIKNMMEPRQTSDSFGEEVAIDGDTIVVGAWAEPMARRPVATTQRQMRAPSTSSSAKVRRFKSKQNPKKMFLFGTLYGQFLAMPHSEFR